MVYRPHPRTLHDHRFPMGEAANHNNLDDVARFIG